MAKPKQPIKIEIEEVAATNEKMIKVISLFTEESSYGLSVYELPESIFRKEAKLVKKYDADIFPIFSNVLSKVARGLFGL